MKTRLQRYLADCGVASRRECEDMILAGRVRVNGQVHTRMPVLIEPGKDLITVDDTEIAGTPGPRSTPEALHEQAKVYLLLNKPKGILVTNNDPSNRKTVGELIAGHGIKERVFPVGRLDMESRGALLMTNDGELAHRLTHPRYGVEKVYIVEVDGKLGHEDLEKIKRGLWLGPRKPFSQARPGPGSRAPLAASKTEPFKLKLVGRERGRTILEVRVSEAKNSEIRRVMARLGHPVRDLNRVAIGGGDKITLKGLPIGEFRPLTPHEVKWLFESTSPEHHNKKRAATQAWYEAKELEKERKRLTTEAATPAPARARTPHGNAGLSPSPGAKSREFRERPERKGKKPFIPPTGRNAGKPLGGNYIGRQRLDRLDREFEPTTQPDALPPHPLGDAARDDE